MPMFVVFVTAALSGTAPGAGELPGTPIAATAAAGALLPANTEVVVRLNEALSSSSARQGRRFEVSVARDVVVGNAVVIPRGTPGTGEVTWRTGRGAFGKSGKMEIAVTALSLNGRTVPVSGKTRLEGRGGTGATIGAVFAGGLVAGAFVTGRSASFEQGHEWRAFTTETLALGAEAPMVAAVDPVRVVARPAVVAPYVATVAPYVAPVASPPVPTIVAAEPVRAVNPPVLVPVTVATYAAASMSAPMRMAVRAPTPVRSSPSVGDDVYARRLAAARGVRGYEPEQGWTISD